MKVSISPVTRVSGLLSIDLYVDPSGVVREANVRGEQFRGFEAMLHGRHIDDAVYFTERICGICSLAHGYTAARMVAQIYGLEPAPEVIMLRQAMLGAEFLQNHIRHFYLLALPDYLDPAILGNPVMPDGPGTEQSRFSPERQKALTANYFTAIEISRDCHEMVAVFGGKAPHQHGLVPSGVAVYPDAGRRAQFLALLERARNFVSHVMLPDTYALAEAYPEYFSCGAGPGNFISFGLFEPRLGGHFPAGILENGSWHEIRPEEITEGITSAWYSETDSEIKPAPEKLAAYSWVKAVRYHGRPFEGGPLARKVLAGVSRDTPSAPPLPLRTLGTMARLVARAEEAVLISNWMEDWVRNLPQNGQYIAPSNVPVLTEAIQANDAPRGPLLHRVTLSGEIIAAYNIITPSAWNFSPKDETGQRGPVEAALLGSKVTPENALEPGRIIRSFDPCLSCATHLIDWRGEHKMQVQILK